jgi:hypothetical protein
MKWFVIGMLPCEGEYNEQYDDENSARIEWNELVANYNKGVKYLIPVMLIKGEVVERFETDV